MILIWWYVSDFFNFVFDLLETVFWFINDTVGIMTDCISFLGRLFLVTPLIFKVSLLALASISVIYKLIGRESQS